MELVIAATKIDLLRTYIDSRRKTTSRAAGGAGLSTPKIRDGRKEPTTQR